MRRTCRAAARKARPRAGRVQRRPALRPTSPSCGPSPARPDFAAGAVDTRLRRAQHRSSAAEAARHASGGERRCIGAARRAGAKLDAVDPLAVLAHGKAGEPRGDGHRRRAAAGRDWRGRRARRRCVAPLQGTIVSSCRRAGRGGPRRRARADHGIHEDGARDRGATSPATCARSPSPWATRCSRAIGLVFIEAADLGEAGADGDRGRSIWTHPPRPRRRPRAPRQTLDAARPGRRRTAPQDRPAHDARERRRPARSRLLRRIRPAGGRRAPAPQLARGADRADPGRRHGDGPGPRQRRALRRRGRARAR